MYHTHSYLIEANLVLISGGDKFESVLFRLLFAFLTLLVLPDITQINLKIDFGLTSVEILRWLHPSKEKCQDLWNLESLYRRKREIIHIRIRFMSWMDAVLFFWLWSGPGMTYLRLAVLRMGSLDGYSTGGSPTGGLYGPSLKRHMAARITGEKYHYGRCRPPLDHHHHHQHHHQHSFEYFTCFNVIKCDQKCDYFCTSTPETEFKTMLGIFVSHN